MELVKPFTFIALLLKILKKRENKVKFYSE